RDHGLELPHFDRAPDVSLDGGARHLHALFCLNTHVGSAVDDLNLGTGIVLLDGRNDRVDLFGHAQYGTDSILHGVTPFSTQSTYTFCSGAMPASATVMSGDRSR